MVFERVLGGSGVRGAVLVAVVGAALDAGCKPVSAGEEVTFEPEVEVGEEVELEYAIPT